VAASKTADAVKHRLFEMVGNEWERKFPAD
jgi:hypothetical protein